MAPPLSIEPVTRALVTGAAGFVGRPLCRALVQQGTCVRGLGRTTAEGPWEEFLVADLAEGVPQAAVEGMDSVFHVAGKAHSMSSDDEIEYWRVNVGGTRAVLQAARRARVRRFIFLSSVKAAGDGAGELDESFNSPPQDAYGRSKRAAEEAVLAAGSDGHMHAVVLRPSLIYGPGWQGNLKQMAKAIRLGHFPPLPETGNRRSMVHVDDVVQAALLAAQQGRASGRVYILADGEEYSSRRVERAIRTALGKAPPRWHVPLPLLSAAAKAGDLLRKLGVNTPFGSEAYDRLVNSAWYSAARARQELGWRPQHVLEEALPAILAVSGS